MRTLDRAYPQAHSHLLQVKFDNSFLFGDDPDVLELRQCKGALKAQAMKWVRLVEMTRDACY